ncbi:Uncharacterized protein SCF082_LOCUS35309 [Durusdinium trenchii]|uniref:Uncharacterized protein n=1 Tax=Durusdinium trenchii TaxID=1381693 RepID=A0ABP0P5C6_9DINO
MDRQTSNRRHSGAMHPASTALLLKVEIPVIGFDCLLSFAVKPGSALQQVQQGISEVIDELACRLGTSLNEKDLQSNADRYEVAKLECEQQLQDWQFKLSEATLAVLRADRSRSELSNLRESYWREVQNLRQQLYKKQQAEEHGIEFTPASIDLFCKDGYNDTLLERMNRLEDEHKSEIANWKRKNSELLKKMRSKAKLAAGEVEDECCDGETQTEPPDLIDACVQCAQDSEDEIGAGFQDVAASLVESEVQTEGPLQFKDEGDAPQRGWAESQGVDQDQEGETASWTSQLQVAQEGSPSEHTNEDHDSGSEPEIVVEVCPEVASGPAHAYGSCLTPSKPNQRALSARPFRRVRTGEHRQEEAFRGTCESLNVSHEPSSVELEGEERSVRKSVRSISCETAETEERGFISSTPDDVKVDSVKVEEKPTTSAASSLTFPDTPTSVTSPSPKRTKLPGLKTAVKTANLMLESKNDGNSFDSFPPCSKSGRPSPSLRKDTFGTGLRPSPRNICRPALSGRRFSTA